MNPLDQTGDIAAGTAIGRYIVLGRLGAGGMGIVYAAYDPKLDRKVALKLLHASSGRETGATQARARLIREAQAMAKLSHPNVVTVHDAWELGEDVARDLTAFRSG
jgi:serine/threonine protein kinase